MSEEETSTMLVPTEEYLKAGIHIGTKFKTKYMDKFIYKVRPDGLAVLNISKIDERIGSMITMLSTYAPSEILVVSRRENGWRSVNLFGKLTGAQTFAGRYPPGILTNSSLKSFIEAKVIVVVDSWPDRNAVQDAIRVGIPVVALSDTNNQTNNIDLVIPCNNKGKKSIGLLFWIVTKELLKNRGTIKDDSEFKYTVDDFSED